MKFNIINSILEKLETQRKSFLHSQHLIHFENLIDADLYISNMVFIEQDILEIAIEGFCTTEDIFCLNDMRDYQHETVRLFCEQFEAAS